MHKRRKGKAVALRADQDSYYRPSVWAALLALALAAFLAWQSKAHADEMGPPSGDAVQLPDAMQLPDSIRGPGADRIPPGLACTDEMDFSPQEDQQNPLDVKSAAWRASHGEALARPAANDSGCPLHPVRPDKV